MELHARVSKPGATLTPVRRGQLHSWSCKATHCAPAPPRQLERRAVRWASIVKADANGMDYRDFESRSWPKSDGRRRPLRYVVGGGGYEGWGFDVSSENSPLTGLVSGGALLGEESADLLQQLLLDGVRHQRPALGGNLRDQLLNRDLLDSLLLHDLCGKTGGLGGLGGLVRTVRGGCGIVALWVGHRSGSKNIPEQGGCEHDGCSGRVARQRVRVRTLALRLELVPPARLDQPLPQEPASGRGCVGIAQFPRERTRHSNQP